MTDVIKIGGADGTDFEALVADIAREWHAGRRFVVVHGGSGETDRLTHQLGREPSYVTSPSGQPSRATDRQTLETFCMATALVNRRFVEALQGREVAAFGLSGLDGGLVRGPRKEATRVVEEVRGEQRVRILRGQWTGRPERVRAELLELLLERDLLPVVAPIIASPKGEMLNTDGDRLAAAIACALGAEDLVILTNVPGLLAEFPDESTLVAHVSTSELAHARSLAAGRMKKKIMGAEEALDGGVRRVILADGRVAEPLRAAWSGRGTVIGEALDAAAETPGESR